MNTSREVGHCPNFSKLNLFTQSLKTLPNFLSITKIIQLKKTLLFSFLGFLHCFLNVFFRLFENVFVLFDANKMDENGNKCVNKFTRKSANQRPPSSWDWFNKPTYKQFPKIYKYFVYSFTSEFKCSYKCSLSNSYFNSKMIFLNLDSSI